MINPLLKAFFKKRKKIFEAQKCILIQELSFLGTTLWGEFCRKGRRVLISNGAVYRPCLHFVHVYITSDDDWAEEHGPSSAFLNPSVGSAFTGKWVSVCSHVPDVSGPLENAFGLSKAFVNPIVSSHCCDPSDNPLLGLFV